MRAAEEICAWLDGRGIAYRRHDHPPVYTCEEALRLVPDLGGARAKNLFLRDRKGRRHFLVLVGYEKSVDLRALSAVLAAGPLSLASPGRLARHLAVEPGSVTLLALVNDAAGALELVVDRTLWDAPALQCHPLVNTATLVVSREQVERFLALTGHEPRVMEVPGRA